MCNPAKAPAHKENIYSGSIDLEPDGTMITRKIQAKDLPYIRVSRQFIRAFTLHTKFNF
jgi:hypothetical protein